MRRAIAAVSAALAILAFIIWMRPGGGNPLDWRLAVDQPVAYSPPFEVRGSSDTVTLRLQTVQHGTGGTGIHYELLVDQGGIYRALASTVVNGDRSARQSSEIVLPEIRPGKLYRIRIYAYGGCLCTGRLIPVGSSPSASLIFP